jgi:hypothetical protein
MTCNLPVSTLVLDGEKGFPAGEGLEGSPSRSERFCARRPPVRPLESKVLPLFFPCVREGRNGHARPERSEAAFLTRRPGPPGGHVAYAVFDSAPPGPRAARLDARARKGIGAAPL